MFSADEDVAAGGQLESPSPVQVFMKNFEQKKRHLLDKTVPHAAPRWGAAGVVFLIYCIRAVTCGGWYIVSYGLGIYVLNLLIGFLSPQIDPDFDPDGPTLPTSGSAPSDPEEHKPFQRRLPEFQFWYSFVKAVTIAFFMTFFHVFNIPVFWPILLLYFIALFVMTMKQRIMHMAKHHYVPWTQGKQTYGEAGKGGKSSK